MKNAILKLRTNIRYTERTRGFGRETRKSGLASLQVLTCFLCLIHSYTFTVSESAFRYTMSGYYEKDLAHLQQLWNEILSEEEENEKEEPFEGDSSDEYKPESEIENSSDEEVLRPKRVKR